MAAYLFTSNARLEGGVYLLDTRTGRTRRILVGSYRGATRGPDGAFYVVWGHRNPKKDHSTLHRIEPGTWRSELVATHAVRDSHDLRWIDGHFYLVASVGNQIVRLDAAGREIDRMQLVADERDICHLNCVIGLEDGLYCTVFTLSPGERKEKNRTGAWHTEGKVLRLDFERKRFCVVHEPLCQPHSLVRRGAELYLVESHTSTLSSFDPATWTRRPLAQYFGFLRGLAFGEREAVLGTCVMYRKDRARLRPLPWLKQLRERLFPFAGLLVLDEGWRVRRRIPLPDSEVYDLLPLEPGEEGW